MKRRRLKALLLVCVLAGLCFAYYGWHKYRTSGIPFTYTYAQGSVRFKATIKGRERTVELNTLLTKTVLRTSVSRTIIRDQRGVDKLNPVAEFKTGNYHRTLFYQTVDDSILRPQVDCILADDFFSPSKGFEGKGAATGARLTIDFDAGRVYIEDKPELNNYRPPKGTLQVPLFRSTEGLYYMVLPVNSGASYRFVLGLGVRDVLLPSGAVQFIAPDAQGYASAIGIVPVTLNFNGTDIPAQAVALPGMQPVGVFGTSLLANYKVVIDFRHLRLYLEPRGGSRL